MGKDPAWFTKEIEKARAQARAEALEDAVKAMREAIRKTWAFEHASPDTPLHIRFLDGFNAAIIVVEALAKALAKGEDSG